MFWIEWLKANHLNEQYVLLVFAEDQIFVSEQNCSFVASLDFNQILTLAFTLELVLAAALNKALVRIYVCVFGKKPAWGAFSVMECYIMTMGASSHFPKSWQTAFLPYSQYSIVTMSMLVNEWMNEWTGYCYVFLCSSHQFRRPGNL